MFFTDNFSTSTNEASSLSMDDLKKAIELCFPKLYYGLSNFVERGTMYKCKETDFYPEYIIVHPEDFDKIKEELGKIRTLVPLSKYEIPKEKFIANIERAFGNRTWAKEVLEMYKYNVS